MKLLTTLLNRIPEYQRLLAAIDAGHCPASISGLAAVHRAHFAAGVLRDSGRPVVLLCADEDESERLAGDIAALTGLSPHLLTAREFTFHEAATVSHQWEHRRLSVMRAMAGGEAPVVVATVEALLQRTIPRRLFDSLVFHLSSGGRYDLPGLARRLAGAGYSSCDQVEGVGQFAVRGGILDFFSPAHDLPVRVEFWGDEINSMGLFDVATQRRTAHLEEALILPAGEVLPALSPEPDCPGGDRHLPRVYPELATAADYLPPDAVVFFCESPRIAERAKNYTWRLNEDVTSLIEREIISARGAVFARTFGELTDVLADWPVVYLDSFVTSSYPAPPRSILSVPAKQLPAFGASLETAAADLSHYQSALYTTVVLVGSEQRALNLQTLLRGQKLRCAVDFRLQKLPRPGAVVITVGHLSAGLEYPAARLAVLAEGGTETAPRRKKPPPTARQRLLSYADLTPGDLVVHVHHGVGRFAGIVKMSLDGADKDYMKVAYAGADVLYVPATQLDLVSKYIGPGENTQTRRLSKLGGAEWERSKSRAKTAVKNLAEGLIKLYAERQKLPGHTFSADLPWQKEFEEQFEYTETEDQLRCIREVKRDMERPVPMDRLLCGDVGYGKTEVAFRAVMKCVLDGKQAAILAPTTVLARQHYLTAKARFGSYPVSIEMVSRMRTSAQIKQVLRETSSGGVDLLIGTHRLLQKDVRFKDLGLLVVDEEQRFGVTHKEKLKALSHQVDVLTLTATPIPRTLNMALSGIRDMSTIEEPPAGRQPVQTYVLEHDWSVLGDAMRREIERGGQVYYLHNRVETIARTASRITDMLGGDVRVAVAHGRMTQDEISDVMSRMTDGEIDVLVCTTIIETGIDIYNVNTLIIEDADRMGLSQLHQIRGRVGRSPRRAFAYLTYRQGKVLTEVATKRLSAIREFAEFGAGFKIAMRDLEIRGAGNVLGPEQSGFLLSVGYDMYLSLLEEAVLEARGESARRPAECSADLSVDASIPDSYIPSPEQRMDVYRRIARVRTGEEADDLTDELIDRYGDPPVPVNNLIAVALLRSDAARAGVTELSQKGNSLNVYLSSPNFEMISALCGRASYRGRLLFSAGERPYLALRLKKGDDVLLVGQVLVEDILQNSD